jgi:CheY-like chemotaxis protein
MSAGSQQSFPLKGKSALVVEDEPIVSFLIEDTLSGLGCTDIRLAGTLDAAQASLDDRLPDLAVLDVNLGGQLVYPVAERLLASGIPFVFTTGYGVAGIAAPWKTATIVAKPFVPEQLAAAVLNLIAR